MMEAIFGLTSVVFIVMMVAFVKLCHVSWLVEQVNLKVNDAVLKLKDVEYDTRDILNTVRDIEGEFEYIENELASIIKNEDPDDSEPEEEIHLITENEYHFNFKSQNVREDLVYCEEDGQVYRYAEFMYGTDGVAPLTPVTNVGELIGVGLMYFGLDSHSDPNAIYVRNNRFNVDFKVVKKDKKPSVRGLIHDEK